jgi:steroid delta-isomerase
VPTPEQIRATVERYIETIGNHDRDGWLANFGDDVVHVDPVGTPAREGRDAVAAFWDAMIQPTESITISTDRVIVCGRDGVLVGALFIRPSGGPTLTVEVVEVFTVDDDGRIVEQRAWWDPAQMRPVEEPA